VREGLGMGSSGEAVAEWGKEGEGGLRHRWRAEAVGASSSFAEGMGEFVLRSMDARFSGSADADGFPSSRHPGSFLVLLDFFFPVQWAHKFARVLAVSMLKCVIGDI
jgi:hypothetical protein